MTESRTSCRYECATVQEWMQPPQQPTSDVVFVGGVEYRRARQCQKCLHWFCPEGRTHGTCAEFSRKSKASFVTGQDFYCKHWEAKA